MYKTLKGARGVRLDNRKVFCAPGPRTKSFERISCRNKLYIYNITLYRKIFFFNIIKNQVSLIL